MVFLYYSGFISFMLLFSLVFLISTIKVLNSVYITGLQISVTSVNPTKLLTVEIVSSIYTIFNPLIIS